MQTVIATFQDRAQAQAACEQLIQRGFSREDVHIERQDASPPAGAQPMEEPQRGAGGISGFFASLFDTDEDQQHHASTLSEAVRRGNAVVVVDVQDEHQAIEAASCLRSQGALDIDAQADQWRSQGWSGPATGAKPQAGEVPPTPMAKQGVLDVVQEELQVGKRNVDQGGVRVIQRVSSKPVREVVRLREERAVVERRPADRPADPQDLAAFKAGSLEVRESAEEAVVSKTARVVEEVRVGKDVREREQVVADELRRKDVDVERMGGGAERERAVASGQRDPLAGERERREETDPARGVAPDARRKPEGGRGGPR